MKLSKNQKHDMIITTIIFVSLIIFLTWVRTK